MKKGEERRMREIKGSRIFVNVEITKSLCDNASEFLSLDDVGFGSSVYSLVSLQITIVKFDD